MSVYLFLWASPNFPVWNQVFNVSFILCMSNVLSISTAAIIPSAGETGRKVVKETQSRDGLLGSVLSALWGACDQIHHVAESLSNLACWRRESWHEIPVLTLVQKAVSGDFWASRRSWGENGCSPLIAGSGIFCDSEWTIQDSSPPQPPAETESGPISTCTRGEPLLREEVRAVNFATH